MTEVVWLLWNRALVDYAKAATMWLLARMHRDDAATQVSTNSQPGPDDPERLTLDAFRQDADSAP